MKVFVLASLWLVAACTKPLCSSSGSGSCDPGATPDAPTTSSPDAEPPPPAVPGVTCATPPPQGAPMPPALPTYTGGTCPTLVAGANTIMSSGAQRSFILVLPQSFDPQTEKLPLLFMWHYIGGSASSMVGHGEAQQASDELRMIVAVPEKKGDVILPIANVDLAWPYMDFNAAARVEQEAVLFDDILACVSKQYPVQQQCVSSVGVSAGALWTSQLIQLRSNRLASAIVISGGVGPTGGFGGYADVRGWSGMQRAFPIMYGWGGASDTCGGVNFQAGSQSLGAKLDTQGSFVVECLHNCGHAAPPVDPTAGLKVLYKFVLDHPYWLPAGSSPWISDGLPTGTPEWCAIGVGNADQRTGACGDSQSCPF